MHSARVEKSEKVESEEIFLRLNSKNLRILGVFQVVNCRTFASPWGNEDTQTLIDILARYGVKTTFFVVGDWAEKYPESVKALHDAGHEVMSHSNHHDHYNSLSTQQIIDDVTASNQRISAVTGVTPTLIRCPYGEYDDHVIAAIRSMGMDNLSSGMWSNRKRLKAVAVQWFACLTEMRISLKIDL